MLVGDAVIAGCLWIYLFIGSLIDQRACVCLLILVCYWHVLIVRCVVCYYRMLIISQLVFMLVDVVS